MMIQLNLRYRYLFLLLILIKINLISSQLCRNDIPDFFYNVDYAGPFFNQAVYTKRDFLVSTPNHTAIFNFTLKPQTTLTRPSFFNVTKFSSRALDPIYNNITVTSSDPNFVVEQSNEIFTLYTNTAPLNYFSPFNRYLFNLLARQSFTDGRQSVFSTAIVQINLKNDNVHAPVFIPNTQIVYLSETAPLYTKFGTVYATDADNDGIEYSTIDSRFSIDRFTGVLQLQEALPSPPPEYFDITVTATDDGSSCSSGPPFPKYSSSTKIRVIVTAVNKNSPKFLQQICGGNVSLRENSPNGTNVTVLIVSDNDRGENGLLNISFPSEQLRTVEGLRNTAYSQFYLEQMNQVGTIRMVALKTKEVFDYDKLDATRVWYLSILATDNGKPPRQTLCNLRINLIDANDNAPVFDMTSWNYTIYIQSLNIATRQFFRVIAADADSDSNGEIYYYIGTRAVPYFTIERHTGTIMLRNEITDLTSLNSSQFPITFEVYAQDLGRSPRSSINNATVTIDYSNSASSVPAKWVNQKYEELNIEILEKSYERYPNQYIIQNALNKSISYNLTSGLSSLMTVNSPFFDNKDIPFREKSVASDGTLFTSDIIVTGRLDAEIQDNYFLYIRVPVNPPLVDSIRITILDENDESPTFDIRSMIASVMENEMGYRILTQIQAYDRDIDPKNNRILYVLNRSLTDDETTKKFHVELNGTVWTNETFTSEYNRISYRLFITAYDEAPAQDPDRNLTGNFQLDVQVISASTNEPKFLSESVSISISEKTEIETIIVNLTIIDVDIDTNLNLGILSGNIRNTFTFSLLSTNANDPTRTQYEAIGQLKVVGPLDYESIQNYTLVLFAFDAQHLSTSNVTIHLETENTKAPVFKLMPGFSSYEYAAAEKTSYSMLTGGTILANDSDANSSRLIRFDIYDPRRQLNLANLFLNQTGTSATLGINSIGLSRDLPFGSPEYHFAIRATDENGTGVSSYAEVSIVLIGKNNKAPIPTMFSCIPQGPNSPISITFKDYADQTTSDTTSYRIAVNSPSNLTFLGPTVSSNGTYFFMYNGILNRTLTKNFTATLNVTNQDSSRLITISIIVCDELNTYPISDGTKTIKVVYVKDYQNSLRNIDLGSIYVHDLNDWFRADRTYAIRSVSNAQSFIVSQGFLRTPNVLYPGFSTILVDVSKPNAQSSALGTIDLEVNSIDSEYVRNAITIRIPGEYPETILGPTLDKLRQAIAEPLHIDTNSIIILSIRSVFQYQSPYDPPKSLESQKLDALTDVIFYVSGPDKLEVERTLKRDLTQFQSRTVTISPNPCDNYDCPTGTTCRATRTIHPKPFTVDTNLTSFVGINILDSADCVNSSVDSTDCSLPSTGTSQSLSSILGWSFEGDNKSVTFDGRKFSNFAPTRFSFDFVVPSAAQNALMFLYGRNSPPMNDLFWIAIEIYQSKLRFQFRDVQFTANDIELNDSIWYHVECQFIHSKILLSINDCQYEVPVNDTINIYNSTIVRLYLGGLPTTDPPVSNLYPSLVNVNTFTGCIRNVLSNGCYLDMSTRLSPTDSMPSECPCAITNSCVAKRLSDIIVPWYTWLIITLVLLFLATILALTLLTCIRRRQQLKTLMGLYTDDTKDNIMVYKDTAGEEDHSTYNLRILKKPIYVLADSNLILDNDRLDHIDPRLYHRPTLGEYIEEKLQEQVIPYANDTQLHYVYEGDGSIVSNLSSIESPRLSDENSYQYLHSLGPKFSRLADIYASHTDHDNT